MSFRPIHFLLALILVLVGQSFAPAGVEGDVQLLKLVAEGNKANREKLRTWRTEASYTSTLEGTFYAEYFDRSVVTKSVDFAYDSGLGAKRWVLESYEYLFEKDGVQHQEPTRSAANGLMKEGLVWRLGPVIGQSSRPYNATVSSEEGERLKPYDFDATKYFTVRGEDVVHMCVTYAGWVDEPEVAATVTRVGDLVILTIGENPDRHLETYTFDLSKGHNLVACHGYDSVLGTDDWTLEYEQVAGAFVPNKVVNVRRRTYEDGTNGSDRLEVLFENVCVNEGLDPSEFTLAAIGLQSGDMIYDQRTGVSYTYSPSKAAPDTSALRSQEIDDTLEALIEDARTVEGGREAAVATGVVAPSAAPVVAAPSAAPDQPRRYGVYCVIIALILLAALCVLAVRLLRRRAGTRGN